MPAFFVATGKSARAMEEDIEDGRAKPLLCWWLVFDERRSSVGKTKSLGSGDGLGFGDGES